MPGSWRNCSVLDFCHRSIMARPWLDRSTHVEGIGAQLSDDQQGSHAHHESAQGTVPKLEHPLCWSLSLCTASSCRMVEQDHGSRRSAAGRVVLSATGWAAAVTSSRATRSVGG